MTFEQHDIGGKPFEKPEVREKSQADLIADAIFAGFDKGLHEAVSQMIEEGQFDVRKKSKAPKKTAAKGSAKRNKSAVARLQKKL